MTTHEPLQDYNWGREEKAAHEKKTEYWLLDENGELGDSGFNSMGSRRGDHAHKTEQPVTVSFKADEPKKGNRGSPKGLLWYTFTGEEKKKLVSGKCMTDSNHPNRLSGSLHCRV